MVVTDVFVGGPGALIPQDRHGLAGEVKSKGEVTQKDRTY